MKKIIFLVFISLSLQSNGYTDTETIQVYDRHFPEKNIEISIVPINKEFISKAVLNNNILFRQLVGFYILITNTGKSTYHIWLSQVVYQNVLGESVSPFDKVEVKAAIDNFTLGWYWFGGIFAGSISEHFNQKNTFALSNIFKDTIIPANQSVSGIMFFPFSSNNLIVTRVDDASPHEGEKAEPYTGPYPIKNSKLTIKLVDEKAKVETFIITFDKNFKEDKLVERRDSTKDINVEKLPIEKWPKW